MKTDIFYLASQPLGLIQHLVPGLIWVCRVIDVGASPLPQACTGVQSSCWWEPHLGPLCPAVRKTGVKVLSSHSDKGSKDSFLIFLLSSSCHNLWQMLSVFSGVTGNSNLDSLTFGFYVCQMGILISALEGITVKL